MLINYLKIAWKVLGRNRFFTFISLFGISFTLMILLVITSFLSHLLGENYPEDKRDRSLYVMRSVMRNTKQNGQMTGPISAYFVINYLEKMQTPEKVAFMSFVPSNVNTFVGNKKLSLFAKYTDAEFWNVLNFKFIEGKPYQTNQVANSEKVVVITEDTRRQYFGEGVAAVGKYININNESYRISGVVKEVPITRIHVSSDVYMPYTHDKINLKNLEYNGRYCAILLASTSADVPKMRAEFDNMAAKLPLPDPKSFDKLIIHADDFIDGMLRNFTGIDEESPRDYFMRIGAIFAFLFMLLPAVNLINVNISRILERSSEIGVRKAFGASSPHLVLQFIVENIAITFIGGLIGFVGAGLVVYIINNSGLIPYGDLTINFTVLATGLTLCLIFGVLSGVYPAFRMSRLHIVKALKAGE
ncbi:ABC transporter permease [Cytophagaceae bacterium DM2B3-1]|uniref:ABC transporter permease n=1 Tax=Xanthocytophaga flava TaxID=3048013 RepID=A0ABT7CHS3_9BACT|nr:ABC transporter permease [Xanthocytophaga flavus]MDJ1493276.1 ABC transporter permease [Xanthocytophaga flavus]